MAKKNGSSGGVAEPRKARKKEIGVEALKHNEAKRRYIPTAELESVVPEADKTPIRVAYERRNRDLDPQLVWRGKDEQDAEDLMVDSVPIYIQEKIQPEAIIRDLFRRSRVELRLYCRTSHRYAPPVRPRFTFDQNDSPDSVSVAVAGGAGAGGGTGAVAGGAGAAGGGDADSTDD